MRNVIASISAKFKHISLIIPLIVSLISIVRTMYLVIVGTASDFSVYYVASYNLFHSQPLLTTGYTDFFGYPVMKCIFYPLTMFSYPIAQTLFTLISIVCLMCSIILILKLIGKLKYSNFVWMLFFSVLSFPVKFTIGMGQINLIALLLLLLSMLYDQKNKQFYSGLHFALACMLKPQLAACIIVLLLYKKWTTISTVIGFVLMTTLLYVSFFGWTDVSFFLFTAIPKTGEYIGRDIYFNQSLSGMIGRFNPTIAPVITSTISIIILAVSIYSIKKKKLSYIQSNFFILIPLLLIEPLSWQHHGVFLLPAFVWLIFQPLSIYVLIMVFVSYMLVSMNIKNPEVFVHTSYGFLVLSHQTIGVLITWTLLISLIFSQASIAVHRHPTFSSMI